MEAASETPSDITQWLGRRREAIDEVTAAPVRALAATFDIEAPAERAGDPLPPGWHWLYFLPTPATTALGTDGAEARGEFLPPVDGLPRRMWAGGSLTLHQPLRLGERMSRVSTVHAVAEKTGKQGRLVFVTVRHEIAGEAGPAVTEDFSVVFRPAARPGEAAPPPAAPQDAVWQRRLTPDPVLLFRFSALTFNSHRIHYDQPYATAVEGYTGLVVHGPLQAVLLLELARQSQPERPVRRFTCRAQAPVFATAPFTVNGRPEGDGARLWTAGGDGHVGMTATVEY